MADIDYEQLDFGVRNTVRRLREWGFETTDSGDGVSKPDDERVLDIPHVMSVCEPRALLSEADRLHALLLSVGVVIQPGQLEASYAPIDGTALIVLLGVTDSHWPELTPGPERGHD